MRLPRWWHHFRAGLTAKFWAECPACREFFGGHEWLTKGEDRGGHIATVYRTDELGEFRGRPICPDCTRKGEGCKSHAAHGRIHAQCPFLLGRPSLRPDPGETVER